MTWDELFIAIAWGSVGYLVGLWGGMAALALWRRYRS